MKRRKTYSIILSAFWGVIILCIVILSQEAFGVAEEQPANYISPYHHDDTLRVAIIGDSWAEIHSGLKGDTLFAFFSQKYYSRVIKCISRGHSGRTTKEIYREMFVENIDEQSNSIYCTQPLLDLHPDYCIIMAGINDLCYRKPISYYIGNYYLIIKLLLANGIRPVVMELPDVNIPIACRQMGLLRYMQSRILSVFTGTGWDDVKVYQMALRKMLKEKGIDKQVVFVSNSMWDINQFSDRMFTEGKYHLTPYGYQVMDSVLVSRILEEEKQTILRESAQY